ncbi:MAG: aminoacyl-tRNA hydrolase [Candidatus Gracilibacteria bacterium]|nr:aminoacyl-tRNA hydrolase [Candidatus Gracilibacteria bacterium]
MKIIVGLGNPGKEYEKTKHNVGFMFLDFFQKLNKFSDFTFESKFKAEISTGLYNGEKTLLIKPQTYMNLSGDSIISIMHFYKIDKNNFIVIYDDLSMDFSKLRFRDKGSAGGHNGIKSIIKHLGEDFKRIKVGIGYDTKFEVSDWVLSKFSEEELIDLENEIFKETNNLLIKNF